MSKISEILNVSAPVVVPSIDNLVKLGYVTRDRAHSDRRMVLVQLSNLGDRNLKVHAKNMHTILINSFSKLSVEKLKLLESNISAVKNILCNMEDLYPQDRISPNPAKGRDINAITRN